MLHDKIPNKRKLISMFSHIDINNIVYIDSHKQPSNNVQINETKKFDLCNKVQEKN